MRAKINKTAISLMNNLGVDKASNYIGTNHRVIKRKLLKKYSKNFTKEEMDVLKTMNVENINNIINSRVGKFK